MRRVWTWSGCGRCRRCAAGGIPSPENRRLYRATLAGDIAANSAYYALAAAGGGSPWVRGATLGTAAGVGALFLPERMGLGQPPRSERPANQIMTVAWYLLGGLAAAATAQCLRIAARRRERPEHVAHW